MWNFSDLELGHFKVIQVNVNRANRKSIGGFPVWPALCPTMCISPYSRYLMLKSCDLDQGRFKIIQGHRSWCRSIAHGRFPIRPPLTPSSRLSPFSRYLTLNVSFHKSNGKNNSTSGLTDRSILDFNQKQQVITSHGTLPWWQVWWRSVEDFDLFVWQTHWLTHRQTD